MRSYSHLGLLHRDFPIYQPEPLTTALDCFNASQRLNFSHQTAERPSLDGQAFWGLSLELLNFESYSQISIKRLIHLVAG